MTGSDTDPILEFTSEWRFLSNFYACPFRYKSIFWPTSEHAFQAMKVYQATIQKFRPDLIQAWKDAFPNTKLPVQLMTEEGFLRQFSAITTPGEAKRAGRRLTRRPDWNSVRNVVMYDILKHKFAPGTAVATRLMDTGSRLLQEGNVWGDVYWGVDLRSGKGENHLGKILMRVREELQRS